MIAQEKRWIESGCYEVSETKDEVLEAVLGSCVGVAIVDKKAKIGGLYHILLSRRSKDSSPFSDEIYADRGMPKFLQSLQNAGGQPERMEAVIAGGALIGKLSHMDMHLDIGGRTIEVVQNMLQEAGIPIVLAEIGGFFGARLQLDLRTLKCRIDPAYPAADVSMTAVRKLTEEELTKAISRVKPIPQIVLKIIRTFQSEDYSMKDIAMQIRRDQVIAARVLKICNSVYVSTKNEIKSIDQAIVILGAKIVVHLVLASALENFLKSSTRGYSMSKGGVFHHAISAAIVSEHISQITGKSVPDIAYTAGLIHDIGKVLLDQYVGAARPHFYRSIYSDGMELLDAEKSLLGITHGEAGARLAQLWSFPDALVDVVAYHAQPELAQTDPELANVVYLANLILSKFDVGHELEFLDSERLEPCLQLLGLDASSLPNVISSIPWKILNAPGYF